MKIIIVTGASGNLGLAVTKKFLSDGYKVVGTTTSKDHSGLPVDHQNFEAVTVDLSSEEQAVELITKVVERYGRIDAAVCTVGGFAMGKIADTGTKEMMKQYTLNFQTAYNTARPVFIQMMKQGSGRIFLVGSRPGSDMHLSKGMVGYGLAKSLIFRLAELMNDEAKSTDVVTSVLVPSTIDTPQNREAMPGADFSKWVTADSISQVIAFYLSEQGATIREPIIKVYNNA